LFLGRPTRPAGPDDIATLQARYVVALGHVAGFLNASRAEGLALKFLELADPIGQLKNGTVADVVRPAQVGNAG
jgi:hypothetical protein